MTVTNVLIVGAGAVGAFYASRLALASEHVNVSVICRSNYSVVSEKGFSMKTHSFGDYKFVPFRVYASPQDCQQRSRAEGIRWDYLVITTKALPDVNDDTKTIQGLVEPRHSSIVLIQNGVGVEEPYRQAFPENPILSAVTVISAAQIEQGVVKQNRWTRISIGPYSKPPGAESGTTQGVDEASRDQASQTAAQHFVDLLVKGGIKDAEVYDEAGLQLVRWHKLAINASMNPSAVLSGGTGNSEMSLDPELRIFLAGTMNEILESGPQVFDRPWPEKLGKVTAEKILVSTERNTSGKPSMLLDFEAGRPMELEVILGNAIRIARRKGVEMIRVQGLYALLKMAQKRRDEKLEKGKKSKL